MRRLRNLLLLGAFTVAGASAVTLARMPRVLQLPQGIATPAPVIEEVAGAPSAELYRTSDAIRSAFVAPRENLPDDAPTGYGFWSFAMPVSGVLSRSGQPLVTEFAWMKERGWKGVVNLRVDGERGEVGDDAKLPGFASLGLNYLHLPIADGHPPTEQQAEAFLAFATNPANQPLHVHCRGGIGRAGTMTALYRYAVQGWPVELAIEESRAFRGGISVPQAAWLQQWAQAHPPGSHTAQER